jgi:hypothetical protein
LQPRDALFVMPPQNDAKVLSVLHVVAPAAFGGLESVVRALATGHARRGHSVTVAAVFPARDAPHPFVAALESAGVRT